MEAAPQNSSGQTWKVHERRSRILVVDDETAIRTAVVASLEAEGYEVHAESDGTAIGPVAKRFRPDLVVLDVRLPVGPDGFALARHLRNGGGPVTVPVLFLSAADGIDDRLAGFHAGGDDYVVKPFAMAELVARIATLLRRAGRPVGAVWEVGDVIIDEPARTVTRGGGVVDLTHVEQELLIALARRRGEVLSKDQLLRQVWGSDGHDENLVEVHVSSLRRKLEARGPRIVHTMRGSGYLLRA